MRRKLALGTIGFMALLAAAVVTWAQDGPPPGPGPTPGQHQWSGGPNKRGDGGRGEFGRGWGQGGHRMGWQRGGRRGFGGGERLTRMAENPRVRQFLGLTDDQVARLHKISVDAQKEAVETRANMQLRHIELRELLRADNPDHDAIMRKLDEVNAVQGKMQKQRLETMLAARSVLTPDQLKKIKTFRENRDGAHGPMMHRPGGMGRRPGGPGGAPATPAPQSPTPQA